MGMRAPDIDLHIAELVLDGVASGDRHRVGQAIGDELTRLLTGHGLSSALARGADVDTIDAGAFRPPPTARPSSAGVEIARAIHGSLTR
jgi:hypothetical protein